MGTIQLQDAPPPLTPAELETLKALSEGLSDQEIGEYLAHKFGGEARSPRTAQSHTRKVKDYLLGRGSGFRRLAIACYEYRYGIPQKNFERGADAMRGAIVQEIGRLLDLPTIGTEAKLEFKKLLQRLEEGKLTPQYTGKELGQ